MPDVPSDGPATTAKKGLALGASPFKKMPPWLVVALIGGAVIIGLIVRSRKQAATASKASSQDASQQPDTGTDSSQYGADTQNMDQSYLSGYDSGLYSNLGGLPTDIFGGINSAAGVGGATLPSGGGADGQTTASPAVTVNVTGVGGGPPARPAVHAPRPKLPKGCHWAPFGHNRPKPKKGHHIRGLGGGYWAYCPTVKKRK